MLRRLQTKEGWLTIYYVWMMADLAAFSAVMHRFEPRRPRHCLCCSLFRYCPLSSLALPLLMRVLLLLLLLPVDAVVDRLDAGALWLLGFFAPRGYPSTTSWRPMIHGRPGSRLQPRDRWPVKLCVNLVATGRDLFGHVHHAGRSTYQLRSASSM